MKIGIASPYFHTMSGGERYMLTIAEYLSREHLVSIFCNEQHIKRIAREKLSIDLTRTSIVPDVFFASRNIVNKIKVSKQYDLIIFLSDGSIPTSLATRNILHFQHPYPKIKRLSWHTNLKLRAFESVIVNSKFTKKHIDTSFNVDSLVIYPPVPVSEFYGDKKMQQIISVGRFDPFKKQDALIMIFEALHAVLPRWKLVLAGGLLQQNTDYFTSLKNMAQKLPVTFLPNVSFDELLKQYAQSSLYWHGAGYGEDEGIHPERMEHFGITTIEAMAAECIPLVYNGGGQREIISQGKSGILWRRDEELLKQTIHLIKNRIIATRMRNVALRRSKEYSVVSFEKQIENLILKHP